MFQRIYLTSLSIICCHSLDPFEIPANLNKFEAVGSLAKETLIAFSNYLTGCDYVPTEIQNGGKPRCE